MNRLGRLLLALLLIAAAAHLPLLTISGHGITWAASHTSAVLVAAATVLLLRTVPGTHQAVTRLAGPHAARIITGGRP